MSNPDIKSLTELLKVEGINCKGFGLIPKFIMFDVDISIESKAIYSYLCSLAGNGTTAFPSRDTIISKMHINKESYYKYYNELLKQGYIVVQKDKKVFPFKNTYLIVANPRKFQEFNFDNNNNEPTSHLRFSGMKSFGFGFVPYAVMIDERLDIKAKGIYSYFCVYAGSGDVIFPQKNKILHHLNISHSTYYKYYNQLVIANYITVIQRTINGRFNVNDYYINDNPDIEIGQQIAVMNQKKSKGKKSPSTKIPYTEIPYTEIPYTKKPDAKKPDTIINSVTINSINYKQVESSSLRDSCKKIKKHCANDEDDELQKIYESIGINTINCKSQINALKTAIADLFISCKAGEQILPKQRVEDALKNLTPVILETIVSNYQKKTQNGTVYSPTDYIKKMIINASINADMSKQNAAYSPSYDIDEYIKLSLEKLNSNN